MKKLLTGLLLGVLIAAPVSAAPPGVKFDLTVDHPEGTVLNDNEVVYVAHTNFGSTNGFWRVRHRCFDGTSLILEQTKGLYFQQRDGDAYFLTFGDSCEGVVLDYPAEDVFSNTVTYSTNPLP